MEQPASDSQILSLVQLLQANICVHLEVITYDGVSILTENYSDRGGGGGNRKKKYMEHFFE